MIDVVWVADDAERGTFWCDQNPRHGRCVRKFAVTRVQRALDDSVGARKEEGDVPVYLGTASRDDYSPEGSRRWIELNASPFILQSLGWVTESVLEESPRGFSTTRGELLRDLAP